MDGVNLPIVLVLVWDLKRVLDKGLSVQSGVQTFLKRKNEDKFVNQMKIWLQLDKNARLVHAQKCFNMHQMAVLRTIELGLSGQSIYEQICNLESEIVETCETDIQEHIAKLPILMQIPLIFLVFPAICILLLVPTLAQLSF